MLQALVTCRGALDVFDFVDVYDSTERWVAPRLVAAAQAGHVVRFGESPAWLDRALSQRER